jgi:hypothetical protein
VGGDGKDRTTLIQTHAATQELLFDPGLCKTEERTARKRLRYMAKTHFSTSTHAQTKDRTDADGV